VLPETYETVLNYISTTRTSAGLTVAAKLNSKTYQKGQEVADEEKKFLSIRRHRLLAERNYTIKPADYRNCEVLSASPLSYCREGVEPSGLQRKVSIHYIGFPFSRLILARRKE